MVKKTHKGHLVHKYLPEFVYGSIDGIITTFAIIAGVIGAALNPIIILILGFANLFADGFSMASSNYLSQKSENQLIKIRKGKVRKKPLNTAIATFLAFILIGIIPLISFVLASITKSSYLIEQQFNLSFILTGFALLIVGAVRGEIAGKNKFRTAFETLIIGGIASLLAFGIGYIIQMII